MRAHVPAPDADTLSHWVKQAFIAMRREMEATLRAAGLTVPQWRALGVLRHAGEATPTDIGRALEIEPPSVTSLLKVMERHGWVRRSRSATDARVTRVALTARGRRLAEQAGEITAPVEARLASTLSAPERATLKRLLRGLVEGMSGPS